MTTYYDLRQDDINAELTLIAKEVLKQGGYLIYDRQFPDFEPYFNKNNRLAVKATVVKTLTWVEFVYKDRVYYLDPEYSSASPFIERFGYSYSVQNPYVDDNLWHFGDVNASNVEAFVKNLPQFKSKNNSLDVGRQEFEEFAIANIKK